MEEIEYGRWKLEKIDLESGENSDQHKQTKTSELDMDLETSEKSDSWDPMKEDYYSYRNIPSLKPNDMESILTGRNPSVQDLCPLYDGVSESCLKIQCKKMHIKKAGPRIAEKYPKLSVRTDKDNVFVAMNLNPRKVAPPASVFSGIVSSVDVGTPFNFFIVPEYEMICACSGSRVQSKIFHDPEDKVNNTEKHRGMEGHQKVVKDLNEWMTKNSRTKQWHDYGIQELVAFNINSIGPKNKLPFWVRGVVCEPVYLEEGDGKCPPVELFLFDSGHTVHTTTRHICQLPRKFCKTPPFSNRCSLYGVKPRVGVGASDSGEMESQWSAEAVEDFQRLVKFPGGGYKNIEGTTKEMKKENTVVVEVKRSPCTDADGVFQVNPYLVMLTVSDPKGGRAINVSEEMVRLGHVDFVNFNPGSRFSFSAWEFLKPLSSLP